tara:strand:- start:410 stop:757 length:348 start_codon:yes stop_codon:yes gene_type:complete
LNVITIGKGAFKNTKITSVDIPENVQIIDDNAFENTPLENVNFKGNSLKSIGTGAFRKTNLTSIEIPFSVDVIKVGAFTNNSINEAIVPENTRIEFHAFDIANNVNIVRVKQNKS